MLIKMSFLKTKCFFKPKAGASHTCPTLQKGQKVLESARLWGQMLQDPWFNTKVVLEFCTFSLYLHEFPPGSTIYL